MRVCAVLLVLIQLTACDQKPDVLSDEQGRALLLELSERLAKQRDEFKPISGIARGKLTVRNNEDPPQHVDCTLWFTESAIRTDWFDRDDPSQRLASHVTNPDIHLQYDATGKTLGIDQAKDANRQRLGYDGRIGTYQSKRARELGRQLKRYVDLNLPLHVSRYESTLGKIIQIDLGMINADGKPLSVKQRIKLLDCDDGILLLLYYQIRYKAHIPGEYVTFTLDNQWAQYQGHWYIRYAEQTGISPYRKPGTYHISESRLLVDSFISQPVDEMLFTQKGMQLPTDLSIINHITGTITKPGKPDQQMSMPKRDVDE